MPVPTGRLVALAAALAVVVALVPVPAPLGFVVATVVWLGLAIVDWRLAPRPDAIGVSRDIPGVIPLGGEAAVRWRVTNPVRRPVRVAVADDLAPSLHADTRRFVVAVPPGAAMAVTTAVHPSRRGRFQPSDVVVRVDGPLGLASRQGRRMLVSTVRVYPHFRSREEAELRIERARILEVGLRSAKGRGGGTEFESLREYGPDDDYRRVDWAATARLGRPIVRTYRSERNQTVLLLLDSGRMMAGRVAGVPRIEHSMDAVMAVTTVASRLGDRAGLVAFADDTRAVVAPAAGRAQLGRVTEAMYELEPRLVEADYRRAFTETLLRFRRRALLIVFTDLAAEALAETLFPALPLIVKHHLVVVASVRDPAVVEWSHAHADDAEAAYRKAAAVVALEERRVVAARLRGMGVTVVDAPPGRLAADLADAYLRVKATGRL